MRAISAIAAIATTTLIVQTATKSEVAEVAANGFQIKMTVPCTARPNVVYDSFINHVGEWWDKSHTYTQDASNMSVEARPHGWLIEKLPEGGFVRHFELIYLAPNKTIRLDGGMGPLQEQGVTGSMTINFKPDGDGTNIDLTYNVGGFMPGGQAKMKQWSEPVKMVITQQIQRLSAFAEKQ